MKQIKRYQQAGCILLVLFSLLLLGACSKEQAPVAGTELSLRTANKILEKNGFMQQEAPSQGAQLAGVEIRHYVSEQLGIISFAECEDEQKAKDLMSEAVKGIPAKIQSSQESGTNYQRQTVDFGTKGKMIYIQKDKCFFSAMAIDTKAIETLISALLLGKP